MATDTPGEKCSSESAMESNRLREFEVMESSSPLNSAAAVTDVTRLRESVVSLSEVSQHYGNVIALDGINLEVPAQQMIGIIGPDGVGKSTLLGMIAGVRRIQSGQVEVLGGNIADAGFRNSVSSRIAYLPQGLGKNLYP